MIEKMSEADVFKMLVDEAYDREDTERINELSESRGTNIQTIRNFYNVNKGNEIIREL